jgi:hypothetical protein
VYFGGDTAFDESAFRETRARFGPIDVALLPIAPIQPDTFMRKTHISADEAIQTFRLLGAKRMIPMHYDPFPHGLDPIGTPLKRLGEAMATHGVAHEDVIVLPHGGQAVLIPKADEANPNPAVHGVSSAGHSVARYSVAIFLPIDWRTVPPGGTVTVGGRGLRSAGRRPVCSSAQRRR